MYQQTIHIGEDAIEVVAEYTIEEDAYAVVTKIIHNGHEIPVGLFDLPQIEAIGSLLDAGHHNVMRELAFQHGEDVAAERAAFRAAYED